MREALDRHIKDSFGNVVSFEFSMLRMLWRL